MVEEDTKRLMDSILDYTRWVRSLEEQKGSPSHLRYTHILTDFLFYVIHKGMAWEDMFTLQTLEAFQIYSGYKGAYQALRSLSDYLFTQGRIDQPLQISEPDNPLPELYEHYLHFLQSRQVSTGTIRQSRQVLSLLHGYLQRHDIHLSGLKIEHLDAFMAAFKVAHSTRRTYRSLLRGFLKYLYHEKKAIGRDLAPLLVGPRHFVRTKPPKFLRPKQVQKLFDSLNLFTPTGKRTCAMVHLAYSLGLRPVEISKITLDDISFQRAELILEERKMGDALTLPVPDQTIKAIALYVSQGRPQSPSRHLFLTHQFPYRPVSPSTVFGSILRAMKKAGLPSSAYWLRHTYAQNLLLIGRSVYELKEMMGHQDIRSTERYLHINAKLMRKVLFNEEL
jgi:site-specific recombinase XerD